jgi:H+/Na+-translocating ferredoxin:NAD+ oxidoreductase subunit G
MQNNMPETILRHTTKTAVTLVAFAFIFTLLMTVVYQVTKDPIAESEAQARINLFHQVIPDDQYDNDVLNDTIPIAPNHLLGNKQQSVANIARQNGQAVAVILEAIAHDGYSGDIKLLVAISLDGTISGVRVIKHTETPGLGDYIEIVKSNWIKLFDGESLSKTSSANWAVKKDGGHFDYMAGATITPRAVVNAVHKALQYFEANKSSLLNTNSEVNIPQTTSVKEEN